VIQIEQELPSEVRPRFRGRAVPVWTRPHDYQGQRLAARSRCTLPSAVGARQHGKGRVQVTGCLARSGRLDWLDHVTRVMPRGLCHGSFAWICTGLRVSVTDACRGLMEARSLLVKVCVTALMLSLDGRLPSGTA
jgi:hypothetical protein